MPEVPDGQFSLDELERLEAHCLRMIWASVALFVVLLGVFVTLVLVP